MLPFLSSKTASSWNAGKGQTSSQWYGICSLYLQILHCTISLPVSGSGNPGKSFLLIEEVGWEWDFTMALILILDDEEDACQLMGRILTDCGHEVSTFTEVCDAFEWLQSHRPDLILLDYKLRGTDGISVLGNIRMSRPEIEIILITGKPSPEIERKAAELGIRDYLIKPVEIKELEDHVNSALGLI
jgi:CheY-like chemotaxis protein